MPKKIAFCFLIYDSIIHEDLWELFFKNIDKNRFNIYIHYKNYKPAIYFEKYKLLDCIETKYEDHTIPLAYNVLFRKAYEDDTDNYKFIILSGACIPLKSFNYVYEKLTNSNKGYFNICPQSFPHCFPECFPTCFPNCTPLAKLIEVDQIFKSHNWFILNRTLVKNLCFDKDDILNMHFKEVYAPAEYFYYTYIKLLHLEDEIIATPNLSINATTFTNWSDTDYKYSNDAGLKNYSSIEKEDLLYLINSESLFGRKFNEECNATLKIKEYIECITTPIL